MYANQSVPVDQILVKSTSSAVILLQFANSESWDSSYEKSWVPVQNHYVP